jgi:hypothetical protein
MLQVYWPEIARKKNALPKRGHKDNQITDLKNVSEEPQPPRGFIFGLVLVYAGAVGGGR